MIMAAGTKKKGCCSMLKKTAALLLSLLIAVSFASCATEEPVMPEPETKKKTDIPKPDIGENYYGNINYDYLINGQIPFGKNRCSHLDDISDEMEKYVYDMILRCVSKEQPEGNCEYSIKELYQQFLDIDTREKTGADLITVIPEKIDKCKTLDEYFSTLGWMYQEYGISSFFRFDVQPDYYDTSVNKLFLMNFNSCGNMKENFTRTNAGVENIGKLTEHSLTALDTEVTEARDRAKKVVSMINDIMYESTDSDTTMDIDKHYNIYDKKELNKLYSNVDMQKLLKAFGFETSEVIVHDVPQSKKINEYFTEDNFQLLKDYAVACTMFKYSSALPPSFKEKMSGNDDTDDMKKSVKNIMSDQLQEEIGFVYGSEICTDEVMNVADKMMNDIRSSCRDLIKKCSRLSDDSRKKYLDKLDNMIILMGYNKNYKSPFSIVSADEGGNLLQNVINIQKSWTKNTISKLSVKPDRNSWDMTAITANAVYNPYMNTVTIPAAMLSKASFDPSDSEYRILGVAGYCIAHEINHAFDSNGFLFDKNGCYNPELICKEDRDKYKQVLDNAEKYYNNYKLLDIYNINGKLTLSENIADLAAVQCLTNITDNKDNLREIFEGAADIWGSLDVVEDIVMRLDGDLHSPNEARVNAVFSSTDKFYEAYDIAETDKMYVAPENRIRVW